MGFQLSEESRLRLRGHEEMRTAFRDSLTREQAKAVLAYSVISPRTMNIVAARKSGAEGVDKLFSVRGHRHHSSRVDLLQQALLASPRLSQVEGAPNSVTIFRGLWHHQEARRGKPEAALERIRKSLPVDTILDDGIQHRFHSWSLLPSVALNFTRRPRRSNLVLRLSGHRMCNYYGSHNLMYREADFIMPMGSHLRVTDHSIEELPRGRYSSPKFSRSVVVDVKWSTPDGPWEGLL